MRTTRTAIAAIVAVMSLAAGTAQARPFHRIEQVAKRLEDQSERLADKVFFRFRDTHEYRELSRKVSKMGRQAEDIQTDARDRRRGALKTDVREFRQTLDRVRDLVDRIKDRRDRGRGHGHRYGHHDNRDKHGVKQLLSRIEDNVDEIKDEMKKLGKEKKKHYRHGHNCRCRQCWKPHRPHHGGGRGFYRSGLYFGDDQWRIRIRF